MVQAPPSLTIVGINRAVTLEDIADVVTRFYGVSIDDLRSPSRVTHFARPRQVVMYLGREVVGATLAEIGAFLDRDHSSVSHGEQNIARLQATDADLRYDIQVMASEAISIAGVRPPRVRVDGVKVSLYEECNITVSRYVFGLGDLMASLKEKAVPDRAWITLAECGMDSLRITARWSKDVEALV